jgi:hypothetical protein
MFGKLKQSDSDTSFAGIQNLMKEVQQVHNEF